MGALWLEPTRCLRSSCAWDLFWVQAPGVARQAPPQSRSRCFWAHSETQVRPCCPISTRSVEDDPSHSLVSLWLGSLSLLRLVSSWTSSARSLRLWRCPWRPGCPSQVKKSIPLHFVNFTSVNCGFTAPPPSWRGSAHDLSNSLTCAARRAGNNAIFS
jgi:hypothetical protein